MQLLLLQGAVAGSCEHSNASQVYVKGDLLVRLTTPSFTRRIKRFLAPIIRFVLTWTRDLLSAI